VKPESEAYLLSERSIPNEPPLCPPAIGCGTCDEIRAGIEGSPQRTAIPAGEPREGEVSEPPRATTRPGHLKQTVDDNKLPDMPPWVRLFSWVFIWCAITAGFLLVLIAAVGLRHWIAEAVR
jgi:hypothetical protein